MRVSAGYLPRYYCYVSFDLVTKFYTLRSYKLVRMNHQVVELISCENISLSNNLAVFPAYEMHFINLENVKR